MFMKIRGSAVALLAFSASPMAIAEAQAAQAVPAGVAQPAADATAPASTSGEIGDIIVTAQKRSESLQKVPLAITAVTAEELDQRGIRDLQGIVSSVPSLNLGQQVGVAKIALRGVGLENISAGAEGSIAFHMDGVFISRSIAALSSFYDVQQVEVLRGPQGTLYGRNATGGSINITTRRPTQELSGYANLTVGNYGLIATEGAISGAIVPDVLAARVAFQTRDRNGYGKNIVTGNGIDDLNTRAVRGSLLFTPTDKLMIDIKGDYFRQNDRSGSYHFFGAGGFVAPGVPITPFGILAGGTVPTDIRDVSNEADPANNLKFWGVSGKVTYDISDDIQFSSLTSFRRLRYSTFTDIDATSTRIAPGNQFEKDRQFSEELQLSGKMDRLNWLIGLYYFNEKDEGAISIPLDNLVFGFLGAPPPYYLTQGYYSGGHIKTDAVAIFGQASYELVDNLRVTVGARYSSEKKANVDQVLFDAVTPYDPATREPVTLPGREKRFKSFTPRIALDYQATPDVLVYGSWSKGFKAGTYNLGSATPPVDPEKVDAFEAGVKSSLFDRRVRLNLAAFYYNYKDLQVGKVLYSGGVPTIVLENAGNARIYGLEAELKAQVSSTFDIDANAAWLHARFTKYCSGDPTRPYLGGDPGCLAGEINLRGNSLSQAPDFTAFFGAQYHVPSDLGEFTVRGEVAWRDRSYFTPFNVKYVSQAPNTRLNAFMNWAGKDGHATASLFVKNLTNKTVVGNTVIGGGIVGYPIVGFLEDPRTFGFTLGYKF